MNHVAGTKSHNVRKIRRQQTGTVLMLTLVPVVVQRNESALAKEAMDAVLVDISAAVENVINSQVVKFAVVTQSKLAIIPRNVLMIRLVPVGVQQHKHAVALHWTAVHHIYNVKMVGVCLDSLTVYN